MKITKRFRAFAALLPLIFLLTACGGHAEATLEAPRGVFVDTQTETLLKKLFDKTKACAGLADGSFEELSIILMPPIFPCEFYPSGCSGSFQTPNLINVGNYDLFDHEVIHYLLFKQTGDQDSSHRSPLFKQCNFDPGLV